jgi:ubiquinone/menaquinone biosynthesis C-methylase UbiE
MTDLFKEKAKDWDKDVLVKGIADGIRSALSENIKMSSGMHVMDFGADTGLVTELLAKKFAKVCAVDVSKAMLEQGFKEIRFVTAHTVSKSDKQYPIFLVVAHKV